MKFPILRFRDKFGNAFPYWNECSLNDRFIFSTGRGLAKENITSSGTRRCLLYGELFTKHKAIIKENLSLTNISFKDEKVSNGGEVLIPNSDVTPTGLATASCLLEKGVILGGGINVLTPKSETDGPFVAYLLRSSPKKMLSIVKGTTVRHLHNSDLAKLEYFFPCLEEQQKIASFFSTFDEKIELVERKLESLEQLKKGLMQKIFSQKIRFKDSSHKNFSVWEKKKLGEVAEVRDGARVPNKFWRSTGVPYIRAKDFNNKLSTIGLFIDFEKYCEYKEQTGVPEQGDVIFVTGGNIGLSIYKANDDPWYVQGGAVLTIKTSLSEHLNGLFMHYLMQSDIVKRYIETHAVGGTIKHFTVKPSLEMPIPVPCMAEQEVIACFFEQIDKRIDLTRKKITCLYDLKKGLMQQMFV